MAEMYEFVCPHCFKKHMAPDNKTGRYSLMSGDYQMLVDLREKEFTNIRIPYQIISSFDDLEGGAADQFVDDYIKFGTDYPISDEERSSMSPITPPRYRVWANKPKYWQCPKCGHKMVRISQFAIMAD